MVRLGDEEALVFAMRELNQQTAPTIKEIERTGKPAIITNHGRFVAVIRLLAPGQVVSQVLPLVARQLAKPPLTGTEPPMVRLGDEEALVFAMRELNQQTALIMSEIERTGKPAILTRHGRFVAVIRPLAPGQVVSQVLPVIARSSRAAKRDQA